MTPHRRGAFLASGALLLALVLGSPPGAGAQGPEGGGEGSGPAAALGLTLPKERLPAPGFSLEALDGTESALSERAGRWVLLNFWATWCKPCEDEMPSMERLYQRLEGEPFELLAVSVDAADAPVAEFRTRFGLSFPILLDPERTASRAYQTSRYPESFLVGADGVVVERYIGPRTWDAPEYEQRIRKLTTVLR